MFNKLKHLKDLRDQAKKMQNALAEESTTIEKRGITITINGNMEISSIKISDDVKKDNLENILTECINDAIKKAQKIMAQKMQAMGGFPGLN